ncbi:unnamed protein product [Brachionus calyciflorus]|uniref:histone deacetylase n=1 Tax=Brachionus calyciflorus TaxID=104777 RepID=A0A813T2J1_9BILA|nr:unnamed protein product [Brachionus calyciflorus]
MLKQQGPNCLNANNNNTRIKSANSRTESLSSNADDEHKKLTETENSGSYSSSTSPSVSISSSSSSSPAQSPRPEKSEQFFTKALPNYQQSILNAFPSHSCYVLPNTSSYANLASTQKIPKSVSSASISSQVKQKLKNCILQKLKNSNAKIESTPALHHPQPIHPYKTKLQQSPVPPSSLVQPSQLESIIEEAHLRRTTSEPNLKVKSALKDRLLEKRNLLSPISATNKKPRFERQNQSQEQIIIAAAIAAATAALTQQQQQQQQQQNNHQNIFQQIALIQQQLLNKSLNTNQFEQLALTQTLLNQNLRFPSSVSYPNLTPYEAQKTSTSEAPKFGHMVHVEEENEILLENELKNVAKQNENEMNRTIFDQSNTTSTLSRASSYQFEHRHKKYYNYMLQRDMEKSKQLDNRYFSDPHLLRSIQMSNNNQQSNDVTQKLMNKSLKNESEDSRQYKYTTGLVYDPIMLKHECTCMNSQGHLETPDRIRSIWNRIRSLDLDHECEVVEAKLATVNDLLNCHSEQYALIFGTDLEQRIKLPKEYLQAYMMNVCMAPCKGLALKCDQDNSWNEEFTPLACRVAIGSTYELASLVATNKLKNGFAIVRPPGSHAEYNKPLGFCYFNTVAIVAKMLKKNLGLKRILIVDWDVHHGNGTQQMTYNDPNILYISLHRHDNGNFFPGTGSADECGQDEAEGKNVNIPWNTNLNPPVGDIEYLAAFRSIVMPIAKAFNPQIVLVSCGFDATEQHPKELGGMRVSPTCFAYMTKKLMSLAEGKVVLALEGGYHIKSICDCSEMCLNALMGKQIPSFLNSTLDGVPDSLAIKDLENVIEIQKNYWPMLSNYIEYTKMSHNQYINVFTE